MEIIDMLTHIGKRKGEFYQIESLIESMELTGVDKCMICSQLETIDNEYIFECSEKYPDKTLGYAVINPWDINGEYELEHCFRDLGFFGLKLNAIRFGYSADRHSVLDPFFDLCRSYGKCVVVHGQSDLFSMPDKWAEMARSFPEVPLVLYHIGVPTMSDRACQLAKEIPNYYLSTCASYPPVVKMAYSIAGPEKLLYSSDAPFGNMNEEITKIEYYVKNEKHKELIFSENAKRIMKMV